MPDGEAFDEDEGQKEDEQDAVDADEFFTKYLEDQVPKADIDDDGDIEDSEGEDSEGEDEDNDDSDSDGDDGDGDVDFGGESAGDVKPDMTDFESLPLKEKKKRRQEIMKSFGSFASAEDFAHLIDPN